MGFDFSKIGSSNDGSIGDFSLNTLVIVGTSSVEVLAAFRRRVWMVKNTSTGGQTITLNVGYGTAVASKGVVLNVGESVLDSTSEGYHAYAGVITAISSAASGQVSVFARD